MDLLLYEEENDVYKVTHTYLKNFYFFTDDEVDTYRNGIYTRVTGDVFKSTLHNMLKPHFDCVIPSENFSFIDRYKTLELKFRKNNQTVTLNTYFVNGEAVYLDKKVCKDFGLAKKDTLYYIADEKYPCFYVYSSIGIFKGVILPYIMKSINITANVDEMRREISWIL